MTSFSDDRHLNLGGGHRFIGRYCHYGNGNTDLKEAFFEGNDEKAWVELIALIGLKSFTNPIFSNNETLGLLEDKRAIGSERTRPLLMVKNSCPTH